MSQNDTLVGWTPESGGRGTWSTIWSCLTIILLSLWVSYHGPATWDSNDGHGKNIPTIMRGLYAILALLIPELYVLIAAWDLREALSFRDEMRKLRKTFSLTGAFYVCMGGYRAVIPEAYRKSKDHPDYWLQRPTNMLLASQILWLCKNGDIPFAEDLLPDRATKDSTSPLVGSSEGDPVHPVSSGTSTGSGIRNHSTIEAVQTDSVPTGTVPTSRVNLPRENLPDLTHRARRISAEKQPMARKELVSSSGNEQKDITFNVPPPAQQRSSVFLENRATIKARSKSDSLAKAVVIFQAFWFIVKCAIRAAHNLPLALLEVLTLSYIACTFFAYGLWWHKPQNVEECKILDLELSEQSWEALNLVRPIESYELSLAQNWTLPAKNELDNCWRDGWFGGESLQSIWIIDENPPMIIWFVVLVAWVSGGLQLLAWNAIFPTQTERYIWRVVSILIMVVPMFAAGDSRAFFFSKKHVLSHKQRMAFSCAAFFIIVVAKLMALILALTSFRAVPVATYDTWEVSNYFFQWL